MKGRPRRCVLDNESTTSVLLGKEHPVIPQLLPPGHIHHAFQSTDRRDERPANYTRAPVSRDRTGTSPDRPHGNSSTVLWRRTRVFSPVDVDLPGRLSLSTVDSRGKKALGDQSIVTSKAIGVLQVATFHFLDGTLKKGLSFHVLDKLDPDSAVSFQDSEDRHLCCSTSPPLSVSPASELRLIEFKLSFQAVSILTGAQDPRPTAVITTMEGVVRQAKLTGSFPSR